MPLPAPYAPPWKRLGEDGVALLAWLGLKVRELWRRNGEGSLPVPAFWPRRWLRLFWPLVLAGVLILALALGRAWLARPAALAPPVGTPEQPRSVSTARDGATQPAPAPSDAPQSPATAELSEPPATEEAPSPPGERLEAPPGEQNEVPPGERSEVLPGASKTPLETTGARPFGARPSPDDSAAEPGADTFETPAELEASRLRAQWSEEDRDELIAALSTDPASLTLTLHLNPSYIALPAAKRQRWADLWLQRAVTAGYSHLRLRDSQRRLLGREALVGGGMILLEPPGAGREAP